MASSRGRANSTGRAGSRGRASSTGRRRSFGGGLLRRSKEDGGYDVNPEKILKHVNSMEKAERKTSNRREGLKKGMSEVLSKPKKVAESGAKTAVTRLSVRQRSKRSSFHESDDASFHSSAHSSFHSSAHYEPSPPSSPSSKLGSVKRLSVRRSASTRSIRASASELSALNANSLLHQAVNVDVESSFC
eukprot:CAMPEP_0197462544 /NCGR_PEP_ID=MMETSP1175-20131217/59359_1 /TAXON_ID=1003142 /ORGANISM="Triceratium dubium, Strain CCMP147" /LENGTH=188 /DNA_ID=CAMNT_0042998069 /DNA_START=147 /DNA_END=713 /DNA_ORIENTATION=-